MEAVVSEWLALASEVWPRCVPVSEGEIDAIRALLLAYQERGRALEEANARIGVMTGRGERCPQCADTKRDCANAIAAMAVDFNRARATLKGKSHD